MWKELYRFLLLRILSNWSDKRDLEHFQQDAKTFDICTISSAIVEDAVMRGW